MHLSRSHCVRLKQSFPISALTRSGLVRSGPVHLSIWPLSLSICVRHHVHVCWVETFQFRFLIETHVLWQFICCFCRLMLAKRMECLKLQWQYHGNKVCRRERKCIDMIKEWTLPLICPIRAPETMRQHTIYRVVAVHCAEGCLRFSLRNCLPQA